MTKKTQSSIDFRSVASWYAGLSSEGKETATARLRLFAIDPESAPFKIEKEGVIVYTASLRVDERLYRVDFVIDALMQERGKIPSIIVTRAIRIDGPRKGSR